MSVDPTVYDLQQDERISTVEGFVSPDFPVPDGPEFSYPVVGQAMSDTMWQYVTLGLGDGVLDEGGQPYWLRGRENAGNTLRITVSTTTDTAQALLRGFYHKMTEDRVFTIPGVTSETVFYFCLTYSPVGLGTANGPITLQMYTGTPPTTQGRFHIDLWKLTRKPNQLLTDATVQRVRPKITPVLSVNSESDRPDVSKVLWGTRVLCHDSGVEYRAMGSSDETGGPTSWVRVNQSRGWTEMGLASGWDKQGVTPAYRIVNGYVELRGTVKRSNGSAINTSDYHRFSYIPGLALPDFNATSNGTAGRTVAVRTVMGSSVRDTFEVYAREGGTTWFSIDGIRIPIA